jgi:hypothetical protein
MKKYLAIAALCAAGFYCAPALALNQSVASDVFGQVLKGAGTSAARQGLQGGCQADLSVESIELRKNQGAGVLAIRVVVANVGTERFIAQPRFMPTVTIETVNGATGVATQHRTGNLAQILPGGENRSATALRRTAFGSGQNVGTVRAYVTLNPAAPQCGTDADSTNNELRLTNEQVRAWLRGSAPSVIIPRSSLTY